MPTPDPDDITKALMTAFSALATAQSWTSRVEWPNRSFDPNAAATPWYRPTVLQGIPEAAALGSDAPDRHVGVFQVSGFFPKNLGDGSARTWASTVLTEFPRGGSSTYGTVTLLFEKSYLVPAIVEETFYHVIVRVEYRTDL